MIFSDNKYWVSPRIIMFIALVCEKFTKPKGKDNFSDIYNNYDILLKNIWENRL
jgi:hypothetical protein